MKGLTTQCNATHGPPGTARVPSIGNVGPPSARARAPTVGWKGKSPPGKRGVP